MKVSTRVVRYILIILSIVIFAYTIQIFVQNFNIEKEIKTLKTSQYQLSGDTYWMKNYYEPFLKTKYAELVFKHRAGILNKDEILVKIAYVSNNLTDSVDKKKKNIYNDDMQEISCMDYLKSLYKKYLFFN